MTTPSPDHVTRPDFGIAVRGYDRAQVDAYFGRVVEWLADAERRAAAAERARESLAREVEDLKATVASLEQQAGLPAPQSMSAFSERMSQVMESALQAAQELRAEAEREARERHRAASEEADQVLAGAREEAGRIVEQAREERRAAEADIETLRAARAEALQSLLELQDRIAAVIGEDGPGSANRTDGAKGEADPARVDDAAREDDTSAEADEPRDAGARREDTGAPTEVLATDVGATTGVLVTAAPTVVQPAVKADGGPAPHRRRSA